MKLRLIARYQENIFLDYHLVDILRILSAYDRATIIGRFWKVSSLYLHGYLEGSLNGNAFSIFFPEYERDKLREHVIVAGERLLERSAVIHQFEDGLLQRIAEPFVAVFNSNQQILCKAQEQLTYDLEIECREADAYVVTSCDSDLLLQLEHQFALTQYLAI